MSALITALERLALRPIFGPIVVLVLGALTIGGRSIALDEAFSWGLVNLPDAGETWDGIEFTSGNMLSYFAVLKVFASISNDLIVLRIPTVAATIGTAWMMYRIGRSWFDPTVGAVAGALTATSVPLLYYAIEVRSYAFVALGATVMWHQLEAALRTDRRAHWIAVGAAAGFAVSAHVIHALALPAFVAIAFALMADRSLTERLLRLLPIGVGVLPTAVLVALGGESNTDWIPGLGPSTLGRAIRFLAGDHGQFTRDYSGFIIVGIYGLLYLAAAIGFLRGAEWHSRPHLLAWVWFLSLPATVAAVSIVQPLLWHRFLIGALPGGILVAAVYLSRVRARQYAWLIVAALVVLGGIRTLALRPFSPDEYEDLAAFIEDRAAPGDSLSTITPWTRVGLDYYWRDGAPVEGRVPFEPDFDHEGEFQGFDWIEPDSRIWLVDRAESSQIWSDQTRDADEFRFEEAEPELPDGYALVDEFDVQRFRIRLYEPGSGSGS